MARRGPRQQVLKLGTPSLTSDYEVLIVHLADVEALPPHVRERLRKHYDGRAGAGMVFLRDVDEVRQALGNLHRERRQA